MFLFPLLFLLADWTLLAELKLRQRLTGLMLRGELLHWARGEQLRLLAGLQVDWRLEDLWVGRHLGQLGLLQW